MSMDVFTIGPPPRGLFLFGFGKRAVTPMGGKGEDSADPREPPATTGHRPSREVPINPYAESLRNLERLEHGRQLVSALPSPPPRKPLGSHIDLLA